MTLDIPVAFFNKAYIKKVQQERIFFLELWNYRGNRPKLIERCRIILTPTAIQELQKYLEQESKEPSKNLIDDMSS